jgi:hypothetical protein
MSRITLLVFLAFVGAGMVGACGPRPFTTLTIYDKPEAYVRLEFDRTVQKGAEHSHPISLTPEQVAAVLSGVRVDEPLTLLRRDILQQIGVPRVRPAFTDTEIAFFAPLLALALSKTTPEEVVTFYATRYISATRREVMSGGLLVQGDVLHLILANYWSPTEYESDRVFVDTQDDRLTPMQSITTNGGQLDFEPHSAKWERPAGSVERIFQRDGRELAILYKQLPPHPLMKSAPQPVAAP